MATATERAGDEIRVALARQRKTQSWLAEQTKISAPSLSRILAGKRDLRVDELEAIAGALGVPLSDLLAEHRAAS